MPPSQKIYCIFVLLFLTCEINGKGNNVSRSSKNRKNNTTNGDGSNEVENGRYSVNARLFVSQQVKARKVSCGRDSISEMSRSVRCKPRLTVVELVSDNKHRFIPNAVLVKRCSGGCEGFQKCLPTKSLNTTHFVKELIKNKTFCSAVEVYEDHECVCECQTKPSDCSPYQRYSSNLCGCKCNDDVEYRKCKSMSNKKFSWNERKCICECVGRLECAVGMNWDPVKCRCVKAKNGAK